MNTKKKRVSKFSWGTLLLYGIVTLITLICLYPFLNVVAESLSSMNAVLSHKVTFYPIEFQLEAYQQVLKLTSMWRAMRVTIIVTLAGTLGGLFLTVTSAYVMSRDRLKGKTIINIYILFTMYFSAGIIPTFLVVKNLGLYNTYGALILPNILSVFNFIIMRTFFREIPKELEDAARFDGAGDIRVLLQIYLPLSKSILATVGLFIAVAYWNDYFSALMYTQKDTLYTLQLRLRTLLAGGEGMSNVTAMNLGNAANATPLIMKRAVIVISTVPILLVYPWLQKYFVKGVMLGSVKG